MGWDMWRRTTYKHCWSGPEPRDHSLSQRYCNLEAWVTQEAWETPLQMPLSSAAVCHKALLGWWWTLTETSLPLRGAFSGFVCLLTTGWSWRLRRKAEAVISSGPPWWPQLLLLALFILPFFVLWFINALLVFFWHSFILHTNVFHKDALF